MAKEACLVLVKPDGLAKSLTGNIISALSETKAQIVAAKIVSVSRELAETHYSSLKDDAKEKFGEEEGAKVFESTMEYIQGKFHTDRVLAMVYYGEDIIKKVRAIAGPTHPEKADFTTIRGKYGRVHSQIPYLMETVMHASDSKESAEREIKLWFKPCEIVRDIYPTTEGVKEEPIQKWAN